MNAAEYRDGLIEKGLSEDEAQILVDGKIAKGEIMGTASEQSILKAAEQAVEDAFPEIAKAKKKKSRKERADVDRYEFEEGKEAGEDEEEGIDDPKDKYTKGEEGKLGPGVDASGKGPDQPEDYMVAEQNRESESAFDREIAAYGKGTDENEYDIRKGGQDYDLVAIISKGADDIVNDVRAQSTTLAKSYMRVSDVVKGLVTETRETASQLRHVDDKLTAILKAIGQPVPPRSVMSREEIKDFEVIDSPSEVRKSSGITGNDVIAKAHEELRNGAEAGRASELSMAVAMLESGADPLAVAESGKIALN
jgi:hypothetical protein